jgi:hypothetical protein
MTSFWMDVMDRDRVVGSVKVKPVLQEIVKTSAGGMIGVSSAILFYWIYNDKPLTFNILFMLSLHAFAIPLLACARVLYAMLDSYEWISETSDKYLTNTMSCGISVALVGYGFQIYFLSKILAAPFFIGVGFSIYQVYKFSRCLDDPQMVRKA